MADFDESVLYEPELICIYCRFMDTCHTFLNTSEDIIECNEFTRMEEN